MKELKTFVDGLFARRKETREVKELKEEILTNLEAKVADLMLSGTSEHEAITRATQGMGPVDYLLDGENNIYINQYKAELYQVGLLYMLIAWVVTIPLRLVSVGIVTNSALFVAVLVVGCLYLMYQPRHQGSLTMAIATINVDKQWRRTKTVWSLWGVFMASSMVLTTIKYFGSALWYGRGLAINGPHQFAAMATHYALPVITIIVPLMYCRAAQIAERHEVKV